MIDVAIIGGGWYGCYIADLICINYPNINITLIEKNSDIFMESSSKNQNRLHLGYHYPRCKTTRMKCKKYFNQFKEKFGSICEEIEKNFYCISKEKSKINFDNFIKLYDDDYYNIIDNDFLLNIEKDKIINVKEMYIDFNKAKNYFKSNKKVNYIFNCEIIEINQKDNKVILNNKYVFNKVFNCTYNQIKNTQNVIYEKCITLLYKKIIKTQFDCLTIMDGDFSSIYKYDGDIYTLTNVRYTPLIKSDDFEKVKIFNGYDLYEVIKNFEKDIIYYYPKFNKNFEYYDYYISYKCKNESNNDSRNINIDIDNNIFSVWCGKISLIFDIDEHVDKFLFE